MSGPAGTSVMFALTSVVSFSWVRAIGSADRRKMVKGKDANERSGE